MKKRLTKALSVFLVILMVTSSMPASGLSLLSFAADEFDSIDTLLSTRTDTDMRTNTDTDARTDTDVRTDSDIRTFTDIISGERTRIKVPRGKKVYLRFVPEIGGIYTFSSDSYNDTYGYIFDENKEEIIRDDDGGEGNNFSITYHLEKGVTYYLGARYYSSSERGSFDVLLTLNEADCDHLNTTSSERVEPKSCSEPGYTAGVLCEDCGKWLEGHEMIVVPHIDEDGDNICDVCKQNMCEIIDSGDCGDNATYILYDNRELVISGEGAIWDNVFSFDYYYNYRIGSVTISDGITSIGNYAFDECRSLTSVVIPNSVISIGNYAFSQCRLINVTIPNSVTSIGSGAFSFCESLESITIPSNVTNIGDNAFRWCESLESVTITNGVTNIGDKAFLACDNLRSITIPDSVMSIGEETFGYYYDEGEREYVKSNYFIIYGHKNTAAEEYANENGFEFRIACDHINTTPFEKVEPQSCSKVGYTAGVYCNDCEQWIEGHEEITLPHTDENGDNICDVCSQDVREIIDSGSCGDNATYVLYEDGELVISGSGEIWELAFDEFEYSSSIKSIKIESGITSIGNEAFCYCRSLTSVTIPDSVTSIGNEAFCWCDSLTSISVDEANEYYSSDNYGVLYDKNKTELIQYPGGNRCTSFTIPDSVTSIGDEAFYCCDSLTSVTIPDSVTSIGSYAFANCRSLTSVTIPDSVTSISDLAFYNCTSLTSLTIGNSVTSIGDEAFCWCDSLTSVTIPDNVTSIGADAFRECNSLTSVTIGNSVTSIGYRAFRSCDSLTSISVNSANINYSSDSSGVLYNKDKTTLIQYPIGNNRTSFTIPDSVTSIGSYALGYCDSLTSVTIGNSVTSIGESAFENCTSLTSVTIPDSVTSIGSYALGYCDSLTSVTIGNSVTSIGLAAFEGTAYYKNSSNWENGVLYISNCLIKAESTISGEYTIRDGTRVIADDSFAGCDSLTSVTIPDSVTSIDDSAFASCDSLTSVTIGNSVTSIGNYAFEWCDSLTSLTIGNSVTSIGVEAFGWCDSLTSVTIPDSVTSIGENAFENCTSLTSVTIGNSVTSIGDSAFGVCYSLTSVTIPDSVTSIGNEAFCWCDSLTSLTIGNSVTSIGVEAFGWCESLTSVTIPDSVTSIGDYAFYCCESLTSVTIPAVVTEIGYHAFGYCYDYDTDSYEKVDNFTIYGFKGTAAEAYANDNGFEFIALDEEHTHSFGEWTVVTPATCLNAGTEERACTGCEEKETREITKLTHSYTGEVKANNDGTHSFKCVNGCEAYGGTVDCSGGTATCTQKAVCSVCEAEYGVLASHSFTNYVSDNNATCIADGTKTAKCDYCDVTDTITDTGSKRGHSFTNYVSNGDATCIADGTKTAKCDRCTETNTLTDTGSKKAHSYTGEVKANNNGTHSFKCVNGCNAYGGTVDCSGGTATCTAKAVCSVCEAEYGVLASHSFTSYVSDNNATCLADGTKTAKCDYCTATDTVTDTGSKKEHSYTGEVKANNDGTHSFKCVNGCNEFGATVNCSGGKATCTAKAVCSTCNTAYGELASHSFGEWKTVKEATIESSGTEQRKCNNCTKTEERTIPKKESTTSVDEETNISVSFDKEAFGGKVAEVEVKEDFTGTQFLAQSYNRFIPYNISVYVEGHEAQPDTPVLVRIPLPDGFDSKKISVYHINSITGIAEKVENVAVKDGYISFYTSSFSVFVIADETSSIQACDHMCHKTGFVGFIWKIINFFNKLFRIKQYCECGAKHW